MKKIYGIAILIAISVLFISCKKFNLEKKNLNIERQDGKVFVLSVEIARTEEEKAFGFMERKNIPNGTGMLFYYDNDQIMSFWMKNTPTPLSIAFIMKDGTIRDIFDMEPFSLASTISTGYVRYALEVPQGWFSENGIKTGDKLILDF